MKYHLISLLLCLLLCLLLIGCQREEPTAAIQPVVYNTLEALCQDPNLTNGDSPTEILLTAPLGSDPHANSVSLLYHTKEDIAYFMAVVSKRVEGGYQLEHHSIKVSFDTSVRIPLSEDGWCLYVYRPGTSLPAGVADLGQVTAFDGWTARVGLSPHAL